MYNFAGKSKSFEDMTAIQLNTMNVELWQSIGAIADSEPLMKRLTKYAKKLVMERKADSAEITREEFLASLDRGEEEYRQGKTHRINTKEELTQFLDSL